MPLLESDLYEVLMKTLQTELSLSPVQWLQDSAAVTVVMASGGYPGSYKKGLEITGAFTFNIYLCHRSLNNPKFRKSCKKS